MRQGRVQDKVAMVFGAGSIGPGWGNGKATAMLYGREGARLTIIDKNRDALNETAELLRAEGIETLTVQADVTSSVEIRSAVDATLQRYGRIDILQNNVGFATLGGPVELEEHLRDAGIDLNLKSAFLTCKHVIPVMERQGGGAIVNISSLASLRWIGTAYVSYAAAKAGLNQFSQATALQYARKGIRCNVVAPGLMHTPTAHASLGAAFDDAADLIAKRNALCPTGQMGDAGDVAHASVFLASDDAKYITGVVLPVDGGVSCQVLTPAA